MARVYTGIYITLLMCSLLAYGHDSTRTFDTNAILFSGTSNTHLAESVAAHLGVPLGNAQVGAFNDGEVNINVQDNVRNKDVYVVQSLCSSGDKTVNDHLTELYLFVRTMKRASAASITVVMPYYGYARQDRKTKPRVPISAADIAYLLEASGIDRVVTIDLHCGQIQGFFTQTPVDNLYGSLVLAPYVCNKDLANVVVVSPDAGGVERANTFKQQLEEVNIQPTMAIINKQRADAGVVSNMQLIGSVDGADAIIVDDLCDTGGTLVRAAQLLKEHGANRVFAAITHPVFSKDALEKIRNSCIDEMIVTDTIPLHKDLPDNVSIISVDSLLAETLERIQNGSSVSALFHT